ncbi:MAG: carboxypeptidase-like regulatory domain-containing protein [Candidatus Woesearchaeota archaeon]
MGFYFRKALSLSFLLLFILFFVKTELVYAGCCVPTTTAGQCSDSGTNVCNANYVYNQSNCSDIPQLCEVSCCCIGNVPNYLLKYPCENGGGIFHWGITQENCNQLCQNNQVQTYTISGYIKNISQMPVGGVLVNITNRNINPYVTGNNGYYVITNVPSGNINILATKGECRAEQTINLNENKQVNLTLNCCQYNCVLSPCIDGQQTKTCTAINNLCSLPQYTEILNCVNPLCEWNCTDWNPPLNEPCPLNVNFRTRTCNPLIVDNCEVGVTPNLQMACQNVQTTVCGNGIREAQEECDFNITTGQGQSICSLNTIEGCDLATCTCKYTPLPQDCSNPNGVNNIVLNHVYKQLKINVSWNLESCREYVESYRLLGCLNETTCSMNYVTDALNNNVFRTIIDNTQNFPLYPNKKYCFKLETKFNATTNHKTTYSEVSCIELGDAICFLNNVQQWCGMNNDKHAIYSCDVNNKVSIIECGGNESCSLVNGAPQCVFQNDCERCNSVFGIFGYSGLTITVQNGNTVEEIFCAGKNMNKRIAVNRNNEFVGCYLDYSFNTVDKMYSCEDLKSCYDYKSKLSCETDYCNKFSLSNNQKICEWADYGFFNKGVCRPKKQYVDQGIAIQNCSLCNDPLYNRIYGECTKDTCPLYGYCYFKTTPTGGKCLDGYTIKCSDYDNQNDCTNGVPIIVDTQWSSSRRISGTNKLIQSSDDLLNISVCEWNGTHCYRNADNLPDTVGFNGTDCHIIDSKNKILCERDKTRPITTINPKPHYNNVINLRDRISVIDDNWPLGDNNIDSNNNNRNHTWVYYSLSDSGFVYPNSILQVSRAIDEENYKINIPDGLTSNGDGSRIYVYYFAEDAAKNLEQIKNFSIIYDGSPPFPILNTRLETFSGNFQWPNGYTGNWSTNLYVNITLNSELSMPVVCYYNITPMNGNINNAWDQYLKYNIPNPDAVPNNIIYNTPGSLLTAYIHLWPDRYEYIIKCIDDAGNIYFNNGTYRIEGDLTISEPFPADTTYTTSTLPANISIKTKADGVCRYSMNTLDYNAMEGTYSKISLGNNTYLHYKNMEQIFPELQEGNNVPSKIYKIYTACNLTINNQNKIIVGDFADVIRFAVDDIPPKTILKYVNKKNPNGLINFTNNETFEYIGLYLFNEDFSRLLQDEGSNMNFGPNETYYCINSTLRNTPCQMKKYNTSNNQMEEIVFDYRESGAGSDLEYGPYPNLCYYSRDNGMNQEEIKCIRLRLRNMEFAEPIINIIAE